MTRFSFSLSLLILTSACQSTTPKIRNGDFLSEEARAKANTVIEKNAARVVSIYSAGNSNGVLLSQGLVLSVAHGLGGKPIKVQSKFGRSPGLLLFERTQQDYAFIKIEQAGPTEPLPVAKAQLGETVLLFARTAKGRLRVTAGRVLMSSVNLPPSLLSQGFLTRALSAAILHSAPAAPGDSGGPVFNLDGELLGITVAGNKSLGVTIANGAAGFPGDFELAEGLYRKGGGSVPSVKALKFLRPVDELEFLARSLERHAKEIGKHDPKRFKTLFDKSVKDYIESQRMDSVAGDLVLPFWRAFFNSIEEP
ncbi:MAG: serine protease [Planctomycetota bacterium]|nr:serine protease [Planctomycetota bacterium]